MTEVLTNPPVVITSPPHAPHIALYTLHFHHVLCQLHLNKAGGKRPITQNSFISQDSSLYHLLSHPPMESSAFHWGTRHNRRRSLELFEYANDNVYLPRILIILLNKGQGIHFPFAYVCRKSHQPTFKHEFTLNKKGGAHKLLRPWTRRPNAGPWLF